MILLGIDTGGTFTDFILFDGENIKSYKLLSTPKDPSIAIIEGIRYLTDAYYRNKPLQLVHGSTVATNALLEGKTARTALITTKRFEDLVEIGRGNRLELYNLFVESKPILVPQKLRFGLSERIDKDGKVIIPLQKEEIEAVINNIKDDSTIESIAVCFLFSFKNPIHEKQIEKEIAIHESSLPISLSSDILPEYREYERITTTVVNASVSPIMNHYLSNIETKIEKANIRIMQSNGGSISIQKAKKEAIHTILSGPAGGVVGAYEMAKLMGTTKIITFDMGGTSTDVSLCDGSIRTISHSEINHIPIKIPMIDIHTVGAGGGSIAYIDKGGALNVGPISAGADPGPICYGKGDRITVTDANLFLGRLDPEFFLGGDMKLYPEKLDGPFNKMAEKLHISTLELAEGILQIANHRMAQAIRLISVEKGYDPKEFTLISFGGAGGMHACNLMEQLIIPNLMIPKNPGLLSAIGMILSNVVKDYSQTVLIKTDDISFSEIDDLYKPLLERGVNELIEEGFTETDLLIKKSIDLRYLGQSYELTVPFSNDFIQSFHMLHQQMYSYSNSEKPTETVTIRAKVIGITQKPVVTPNKHVSKDPSHALIGGKEIIFHSKPYPAKVYHRDRLKTGNQINGPAIIVEYSSTTAVLPGFHTQIDQYENMNIQMMI